MFPLPPHSHKCSLAQFRSLSVTTDSSRCFGYHAHRYSRLTRQHGGEQTGLVTLTFDLLTLKLVSESRVTWATSVPILVFLDLSVLDLGPM